MNKYVFLLVPLLSPSLSSGCSNSNPTGIYSSLSFNEESGDVSGLEIFIVYSKQGYAVTIQTSAGMPQLPQTVRAKLKTDSLEFTFIDPVLGLSKFNGRVSCERLVGTIFLANRKKERFYISLDRKNSYWQ